jgi:hypothetical protein
MAMAVTTDDKKNSSPSTDGRATLAAVVTIVSLLALLLAVLYLASATGASDLAWTRLVYALTPIETIAFAAVGWLFGREVHRQQAQKAEARAEQAETRADQAQSEAVNATVQAAHEHARGTTLANANLAKRRSAVARAEAGGGPIQDAAVGTAGRAQSDADELADLAAQLYPELAGR